MSEPNRSVRIHATAGHEINEHLTVMAASAERCCDLLPPGHPAAEFVSELLGAAQRMAWLAADLLVYGVGQGGFPRGVTSAKQLMEKA